VIGEESSADALQSRSTLPAVVLRAVGVPGVVGGVESTGGSKTNMPRDCQVVAALICVGEPVGLVPSQSML
jgi:hypothetical protein